MGLNQHYVPQFLIRPFGFGKKKGRSIHVFDKRDGTVSVSPVKKIACGHKFYDLTNARKSLDPLIGELESDVAPLIKEVRRQRSVRLLTRPEKQKIAFFVSVQMLRTVAVREDLARQTTMISKILTKMGGGEEAALPAAESQWEHNTHVEAIADIAPSITGHLLDKAWILLESPRGSDLLISDNPVTKHNVLESAPFRSNMGIACTGIEIHLPLQPDLLLLLLCQKAATAMIMHDYSWGERIVQGRPIPLTDDNVTFHNSLQVISAERFVFSQTPDFALAAEMIREHPEVRQGPRSLVVHPDGDAYPEAEFAKWEAMAQNRRKAQQ